MKTVTTLSTLSALCGLATAWLPGVHKDIYSVDGQNHFNKTAGSADKRWLPASGKIRGVDLGSLFVFEPWIAENAWSQMGCGGKQSEFDCVSALGQSAANSAFASHWGSWITKDDITQMQSYGLNTVRIPVGYWLKEDIVYSDSEHFPQGGLSYLEQVCGWASDAGFYIIIDLHGAPGAQVPQNPDTGQYAPTAGFYVDYQYERALEFLEWMTTNIHTNNNFRNVGMLEIVNEPLQNPDQVATMRTSYYPNAFSRIRAAEQKLGITANNYLHIQMMNAKWGSGDPTQALTDTYFAAYDDHRYLKWDSSVPVSPQSYLSTSCNDDRGGNWPTIVGEFSLSPPDDVQWTAEWDPGTNQDFYKKWFAAQVMAYEKQQGWIFWTWKSQLGDYRWSYQDAVAAGVIPTDLDSVYNMGAC
ncbi:hypothetical protein VTN77DRAFT_5478 [Rasamsonia byssochlamydoides]|uniref:uncharacterized protein n=1 Tax=Rasamsonia byssochlamydoides TaxID=89139 RepID=UPI003743C633